MSNLDEQHREVMRELLSPLLAPGEVVIAMMPFASTRKRPRGPEGKVRDGLWQSVALHRPLALTDRALYVFAAGRTPRPKRVFASYPRDVLRVVGVQDTRFGKRVVTIAIGGEGEVPFETGTLDDLEIVVASLPTA